MAHLAKILQALADDVTKSKPDDVYSHMITKLQAMKTAGTAPPPEATPQWPEELNDKALSIIVMGASGDLAWKKTYPALFELYCHGLLPTHTKIVGYARSSMDPEKFHARISGKFKAKWGEDRKKAFLAMCTYVSGPYDKVEGFINLENELQKLEGKDANRCFYFALPPSVFVDVAKCIKECTLTKTGWNRLIVEKPFGKDLESAKALSSQLGALYTEDQIYRIDHYLGKEMVQNLSVLRFGNKVFADVWSNKSIASVQITFKEPFGTEGRGGYFDQFGIIRDIIQNHLLQVMTLVAMEKPKDLSSNAIRDEKVHVLKSIRPISLDDVVLGQYVKGPGGSGETYLEDPTVPAGSVTPTYAVVIMFVDNDRWAGVPFILKAAKATDERKAEVRIQFKEELLPYKSEAARDELVLRLQPKEAMYLKLNAKTPGLSQKLHQTELDMTYGQRYDDVNLPDAYEGLIYDCLCGMQNNFVRTDELLEAWKIFTPLLEKIEGDKIKPLDHIFGTRGLPESDALVKKYGYKYNQDYKWSSSH